MGATIFSAPQPTVPVAFRSLMQAGFVGRTVLILCFRSPTVEMLAAVHAPEWRMSKRAETRGPKISLAVITKVARSCYMSVFKL